MSFRPTELTLREVLLDELKKHGIRLGSELSVSVPSGRRAPDAVLLDGGEYVLETKVGEADYYDDVLKLAEWIKYRHIPLRGAFAVLMPEKLRKLPWDPDTLKQLASAPDMNYGVTGLFRDERPGDRKEGSLAEIAEWIAKHVLEPPKEVEPDISFFVRVLSGAVDRLNNRMRRLKTDQLDDIFGGESVFHNILEYEEGKYPLEEMRKAASYLLINQLMFYSVLSRTDPDAYPVIDPDHLTRPSELTTHFNRVLEVDYAPTFGFDIASRLEKKAVDTIKGLVEVI